MGDANRESVMNPAQSENPGMLENFMRENRETPRASGSSTPDRLEKATSYTTSMHASGESDSAVVPTKCPNKGAKHQRRAWREGCWPRRTNGRLARSGHCTGAVVSHGPAGARQVVKPAAIIRGRSRMH